MDNGKMVIMVHLSLYNLRIKKHFAKVFLIFNDCFVGLNKLFT